MATRTRKSDTTRARPVRAHQVVYIHGIGKQDPPDEIKRQWDLALFGREMGDDTCMAYWSDVLHPEAEPALRAQSTRSAIDIDRLLDEVGAEENREKTAVLLRTFARSMGLREEGTRKKVLFFLPAGVRRAVAMKVFEIAAKDTAAYFSRPDIRRKLQNRLRDILVKMKHPVTVVAHSHGSIIAYEVLTALARRKSLTVNQLITIGSPLGIQEVQDFLERPLRVPTRVRAWHNFADPIDFVALDKTLGDDFEPRGRIVDSTVVNTHTRLDRLKPHEAVGYLAHPRVREVAHRATGFDTLGQFLVARDVAADLAVEGRHPVLIEILEPGFRALDETEKELQAREAKENGGRPDLARRIETTAAAIEKLVTDSAGKGAVKEARVDRLRHYVAARLTPSELYAVARDHHSLRVYAVWKSNAKRKLLKRSASVVHADAAWAGYKAFGRKIRWAVLDTGIRHDHPHFKTHRNIVEVWDCTQPGPPLPVTKARDPDGHGTHVAGIIAGSSRDGSIRGMAPEAKLVVYKVLDDSGAGEDSSIIKAIDHIAARNENAAEIAIHGLNLSLGGPYDNTVYGCGFTPLCYELRRLWRSGVLVVVSCGNEGQVEVSTPDGQVELNSPMSIGDPANLEDCIAVGSVNTGSPHLYGISPFSSRGPTSDGRLKPDVVAPGERIESCDSRFRSRRPADLYRAESGTSMAAPHVSGLLAAFLSVRREFRGRPDEVKKLLLRTCTDIGRDRYHQGHGIPNLMRMLLET